MSWRPGLAALVLTLVALPQPGSSQEQLRPLVAEWETMFRIEPSAAVERGSRVTGHVVNQSGLAMKRVRLLVDALEGGRVVGQRVSWLGTDLGPGRRAYFTAEVPAPASAYRVSVYDYEIWFGLASAEPLRVAPVASSR
jgi:hypothetical protein